MARRRSDSAVVGYGAKFLFALIFVTVIICVISFLIEKKELDSKGVYKGDLSSAAADIQTPATTSVPTTSETVITTTSEKRYSIKDKPEEYLESCVFVGDSITSGLSTYQFLPAENVIAEVGINVSSINDTAIQTAYGEMTALDALKKANPQRIYVMLGSNGIAWMSAGDMTGYYEKFLINVSAALPDAEIYIMSIPPVTASKEYSDNPVRNSEIDEYNDSLKKMADRRGYGFVDLNAALKGSDGAFPDEYAAEDGMHFNRSTYEKMIDVILTAAEGAGEDNNTNNTYDEITVYTDVISSTADMEGNSTSRTEISNNADDSSIS